MKRIKLLLGSLLFLSSSYGQQYLGVHNSNYAGVMGTDIQPASFVDGRFVVDVNLGSFYLNGYTNAASFNTQNMPKWWVKSFKPDLGTDGKPLGSPVIGGTNPFNDWILPDSTFIDRNVEKNYSRTSTKTLGIYNNIQLDVLNFMFHINPKIAVGFAAKFRSVTNVDDVDPKLALLLENERNLPDLWNQTFNEQLLDMNHLTWMEYGIIYSQVLKDDGEHFMKMGGKAKWLSGLVAGYMHTNDFDYNLLSQDSTQYLKGSFDYGHADLTSLENTNGFPSSVSKFGLGLDLGFVYEWRPKWKEFKYDMDGETNIWRQDSEKYKARVGVSILDIGGMKFQKGNFSRSFTVNETNIFDLNTFSTANDLEEVNQIIDSLVTNDPDWTSDEQANRETFFMQTPTALSIQGDYHIWHKFYVNVTGMMSLQSRKLPNRVRVANQLSITPSFDHAWFGLYVPVSMNKYSGFKAGLATRMGPLTVGVTDFRTLFATGKVRGAEVYMGLRVPVLYTHPSDIDGDKVSDKVDVCRDLPGVWAFKGCPDSDQDGIQDLEDACPQEAGLPEFQGCPDKDGDGIPDKDDRCPETKGVAMWNGCPDTDNDSIPDPDDLCPNVPGLKEFAGCPDTDGDGIVDDEDACPKNAGPKENNGCPDTDQDGLFDFLDDCPTVAGPKENNGCPWPDTDGDGLLDKDDKCPYLAGPLKNDGCPYQDTDNDGVLDKDDACPNTPGPVANKGCPEIEQEIQEILRTAFENLEFETAKDIIKQESIPSLTELAGVLVKRPEWKLQIAGHTDSQGNDQSNLILSKKRAEAVKNFLVSKGVEAERLIVLYFGETMPIASNDTPEGRQKNRRVEMTIIQK